MPTAWSLQPVPVALALVAAALFAQGYVRLRRRGRVGRDRPLLFALALAAGVLPLVSPLDTVSDRYLLSGHMLEHVLIGDVAPALALVAVRGPLVVFLLPPALLRSLARVAPLRSALAFLLRPAVSFAAWVAVVGAWHVPAAYDAALARPALHDLEHASFVVVGTLVWTQLVDPARRRALTDAGRILYAWGLFAAGHLATLVLLDDAPHYPAYLRAPRRLFGLSPVADQHWAAVVMTVEQLLAFGILTAVLYRRIPRPLPERREALE